VRPYLSLAALGLALVAVAAWLGGWAAAVGGGIALLAQIAAVALLRPAMHASQTTFMARWYGGMGIRALALGLVLVVAVTHRAVLPPLPASLGFLGVLLPLLFLEIRFLG
jgi:F0F1-type ATP synthase assembly protein I